MTPSRYLKTRCRNKPVTGSLCYNAIKSANIESQFIILQRCEFTIGPRIDAPGPLFVTKPDHDGEAVDEFNEPRSGIKFNLVIGEILA